MSWTSKTGHYLAWALRIDTSRPDINEVNYPEEKVTRGESVLSTLDVDPYVEEEPHTAEYLRGLMPTWREVYQYILSLFPFLNWIWRYNWHWFVGDLIAGVTVGCVVVPQGMAYAKLAELPPQFGLYSSFMGVLIYWFFATSKDITIGPVAVMSSLTGEVVQKVQAAHPEYEGHVIASALSIIAGAIVCFIGLIRCGWIVDFIPLPAISAFMTGSAIHIAAGQVPKLMGIDGFSTRGATYMVIINTLKHLGRTKLDAAMGLTAMTMLYLIRFGARYGAKHYPQRAQIFFYISTMRTTFVILLYTAISAGVNLHRRDNPAFEVLGSVPRGFQDAAVPTVNTEMIKGFVGDLPAAVIVLLIEHIAISKSFGRVNNYTIDPSQELVAIGVTNLLGPFLGAYPATGSFSRTAIKSKAGVRTPLGGLITAVLVLLAIYALPAVFWYIPNAALAGVIIHAVGDLITPPDTLYKFWRVNPLEVVIFFIGVIVTIFSSIENGIYCTTCVSAGVLLFRIVKAKGQFLGRVQVHSVIGDHLLDSDGAGNAEVGTYGSFGQTKPGVKASDVAQRSVFLPFDHQDGSNPNMHVEQPYPGIFIYRLSEGFNYPNAGHITDHLVTTIMSQTRRTTLKAYNRPADRPWNDPGPKRGHPEVAQDHLPILKAIILDFSAVNNVDVTSIQTLIDVRNQLDRYAAPQTVDWHFAHVRQRWTKRALVSAGFGYLTPKAHGAEAGRRWKSLFSVAEIGGSSSAAAYAQYADAKLAGRRSRVLAEDVEGGHGGGGGGDAEESAPQEKVDADNDIGYAEELHYSPDSGRTTTGAVSSSASVSPSVSETGKGFASPVARHVVVGGLNRPLFHVDLTSALQSAIANSLDKETIVREGGLIAGVALTPEQQQQQQQQQQQKEMSEEMDDADNAVKSAALVTGG